MSDEETTHTIESDKAATPAEAPSAPPSSDAGGESAVGTALFTVVVVVLVAVAAVQMYFIFGRPAAAPKASRPSAVAAAASGAPSPAAAASGSAFDIRTVRPGVLFGAIVAMQKTADTALTAEQVGKVRGALEAIQAEGARSNTVQQLRLTVVGVLRKPQLDVVMQIQQGSDTGASDPLESGLATLKKIAGDARPMTAAPGARDRRSAQIWPWKLGLAVKQMQKDPDLALSPAQAAALVPLVQEVIEERDLFTSKSREIIETLTPAQREVLIKSAGVEGGNANAGDALAALKGKR